MWQRVAGSPKPSEGENAEGGCGVPDTDSDLSSAAVAGCVRDGSPEGFQRRRAARTPDGGAAAETAAAADDLGGGDDDAVDCRISSNGIMKRMNLVGNPSSSSLLQSQEDVVATAYNMPTTWMAPVGSAGAQRRPPTRRNQIESCGIEFPPNPLEVTPREEMNVLRSHIFSQTSLDGLLKVTPPSATAFNVAHVAASFLTGRPKWPSSPQDFDVEVDPSSERQACGVECASSSTALALARDLAPLPSGGTQPDILCGNATLPRRRIPLPPPTVTAEPSGPAKDASAVTGSIYASSTPRPTLGGSTAPAEEEVLAALRHRWVASRTALMLPSSLKGTTATLSRSAWPVPIRRAFNANALEHECNATIDSSVRRTSHRPDQHGDLSRASRCAHQEEAHGTPIAAAAAVDMVLGTPSKSPPSVNARTTVPGTTAGSAMQNRRYSRLDPFDQAPSPMEANAIRRLCQPLSPLLGSSPLDLVPNPHLDYSGGAARRREASSKLLPTAAALARLGRERDAIQMSPPSPVPCADSPWPCDGWFRHGSLRTNVSTLTISCAPPLGSFCNSSESSLVL